MLKRSLAALLSAVVLVTLCLALPAFAQHAPTRAKISETIEIHAAPETVWARVRNFDDESWHPDVASTSAAPGNLLETARLIKLKSGGEIVETLYHYEPDQMMLATLAPHMDLKVLPVSTYSSYLYVRPGPQPGTSMVEWRAAFYRGYPNNNPPPELNEEAGKKAVGAFARRGLEGLKKVVEQGS